MNQDLNVFKGVYSRDNLGKIKRWGLCNKS